MAHLKHWDDADLRTTEAADRQESARRRSPDNRYRQGGDRNSAEQDAIAIRHERRADDIAAEIARRAARSQRLAELRAEALQRSQAVFSAEQAGGGPTTCTNHGAFIDDDGTERIKRCIHRFAHERAHGDGTGRMW